MLEIVWSSTGPQIEAFSKHRHEHADTESKLRENADVLYWGEYLVLNKIEADELLSWLRLIPGWEKLEMIQVSRMS